MSFLRTPTTVRPPRYDMYVGIHKGLRAFMCETLSRLGRVDTEDEAALAETLDGVELLLSFCSGHLEHENAVIHPAMEARQPGATEAVAREHGEHAMSISILRAQVAEVRAGQSCARLRAALRLYRMLALFVGESFQHMHHEETEHNDCLWGLYSDAELVEIESRIHALLSPAEMSLALRWMVPAMSPAERLTLLAPLAENLPPTAFEALLAEVGPHLSGADRAKLESGLRLAA